MVMETTQDNLRNDPSYDAEESTVNKRSLHEQLAAYALTVAGNVENRTGVWGEHSYARTRGASAHERVRVLLAPRATSPSPAEIDVLSVSPPPPALPGDAPDPPDEEEEEDGEEDDWERRLRALAPTVALARLAEEALDTLRALRLERATGAGVGDWARREGARVAARRLRRALASHWAGGAGGAGWLHAALTAQLPRSQQILYRELLQELRRAAPRLAARLPLARPLDRVRDPLAAVPEAVPEDAEGPWIAWVPSGDAADDRRWTRRLGALVHTRLLSAEAAPGSPECWAATAAASARVSLERLRAEAGGRALVLAGAGAGAALAAWLAPVARPTRLLLLAPPLLTAEGAWEASEAGGAGAPVLCVLGGGAAAGWRGAVLELWARARLLLLLGADDGLRLPRRHRRRLRLPQSALDAAVAEECARWLLESDTLDPAPDSPRRKRAPDDEVPSPLAVPGRAIEIVEGRVMRVSGGTTLTLRPRHEPLAPADILQLPIVFADDAALPGTAGGAARRGGTTAAGVVRRDGGGAPVGGVARRGGVGVRRAGAGRPPRVLVAKRGRREQPRRVL